MNQKIESLTDGQIAKLVAFLKKINYSQEELKYAIKKKLNKSTPTKNDNFDI